MTDAPLPVVMQFWFRKSSQVPGYLNNISPFEDALGFNPYAKLGEEIVPKTTDGKIDISDLYDQLQASGLTLTRVSRVNHSSGGPEFPKRIYVVRFCFDPVETTEVSEDFDADKHAECLREITTKAFWQVRVDKNSNDGGEWISVSCDARKPRFKDEDVDNPFTVRTDGGDAAVPVEERTYIPIAPDRKLHFLGGSQFELA